MLTELVKFYVQEPKHQIKNAGECNYQGLELSGFDIRPSLQCCFDQVFDLDWYRLVFGAVFKIMSNVT
jgi:hypothetical protein